MHFNPKISAASACIRHRQGRLYTGPTHRRLVTVMERGGSRLVSRVIGTRRRRRRRLSTSWKCWNRGLGAARCRGRFPSAAAAPVMRHNQIACMRRDRATTTGLELGYTGGNGRVIGLVRLMSAGGRRPAALHGRRPKTSFANDITAPSARRSARYRHTSIPPPPVCVVRWVALICRQHRTSPRHHSRRHQPFCHHPHHPHQQQRRRL